MDDDSDIKVYDRRRAELSNAPPHMKQDITSIEKYPRKHLIKLRFID